VPAADQLWDAARLATLRACGEGVLVFSGALILKPEAVSIGDGSRVDDFTRIEGGDGVEIGRNVHVSSFCSIFAGGAARLGDYSCMAQGSRILTGSEQLDAAMSSVAPADWRRVVREVSVLDHLAFLGANAVLMPGVEVGVGAVVGAGAVVTRDVPPWEVWAGVPARRLSRRDPQPLRARGVPVDALAAAPLSRR
jgi:acetyltransferase-like isoleucine patch superfamily enzyme